MAENADAILSIPSRMLWAWPLIPLGTPALAVVLDKTIGHASWAALLVPAYLATAVVGYCVVSDRRYVRTWARAGQPEPGRLFRRLNAVFLGLTALLFSSMFVVGGLFPHSGGSYVSVVGMIAMGSSVAALTCMFLWGAARAPGSSASLSGVQDRQSALSFMGLGQQWVNTALGVYEPPQESVLYDNENAVAWGKAMRALWINTWRVSAPTRLVVLLFGGWLGRVLTFRPGRAAALVALAQALGGEVSKNREPTILQWLDHQGWGPAPHVPSVWFGYCAAVCGHWKTVPVAVSVAYRAPGRHRMPVDRGNIFVAQRREHGRPASSALQALAATHGYSVQITPWGIVFSTLGMMGFRLVPQAVLQLMDAALSEGA